MNKIENKIKRNITFQGRDDKINSKDSSFKQKDLDRKICLILKAEKLNS